MAARRRRRSRLLILVVMTVVFMLLARWMLRTIERMARREGRLSAALAVTDR